MAEVTLNENGLSIKLSLLDSLLAFHGSFEIPLEHIVNAYVSNLTDLELQYRLTGTNFGLYKSAGIFGNPNGLIFVDAVGEGTCLVIETQGESIPRIAVQLPGGQDPNALAHQIMRSLPDSGPTGS
ncbi:MAG: hypothetical protein JOZ38_07785 [Candidatus Eremiobacteraeota bacterium]|nr:hypothetical protein [Candidatus Eremiobacteraeota bacterium]